MIDLEEINLGPDWDHSTRSGKSAGSIRFYKSKSIKGRATAARRVAFQHGLSRDPVTLPKVWGDRK